MAVYRYRLIDSEGVDLGPFVSSRIDWQRGGVIERGEGYLRVAAVVEPEMADGFAAYLVVESSTESPKALGELPAVGRTFQT